MSESLPELQDAEIDQPTLWRLADDLEAHAQWIEVRCKGGAAVRAGAGGTDLRVGLRALESGEIFGIQITYCFDGDIWRDTLMRTPQRFRLVRVQVPTLT